MTTSAEEMEFIVYMRTLRKLEADGERTTITIGPYGAMMIIGLVQLSTRHPDVDKELRQIARDFVHQLEPLFAGTIGEEIIKRGNHPEFDT